VEAAEVWRDKTAAENEGRDAGIDLDSEGVGVVWRDNTEEEVAPGR
jgi:hypothetical protein